ncbi:MAG: hypothetical protein J6W41_04245 [Alphaproteobacteria bacterium]|nr:hypothetical protein [Alphaproteobacteria bacterium]
MTQQIAICTKITDNGDIIQIEYKTGKSLLMMNVPFNEPDFEIAKHLAPGDKFLIESRDTKLKSTKNIQIPDNTVVPIKYIVKKISER